MLKRFSLILLAVNLCYTSSGQIIDTDSPLGGTLYNAVTGVTSALEFYDLPILMTAYTQKQINTSNIGDKISLGLFRFDKDLSRTISGSRSKSFGSLNQTVIPDAIFLGRLGITTGLDLFTDLEITGREYRNLFLFEKALFYTHVFTDLTKSLIKRQRPDGTDNRSFFSGHTSYTFAMSTFLYLELNDFYETWKPTRNDETLKRVMNAASFTLLYGWAGYVGYSRIADKKHYLSDVLVGAAAGSLISYFVYSAYNKTNSGGIIDLVSVHAFNETLAVGLNVKF